MLTVVQRVIAADNPLQLGKFPNHPGRQVGLGEPHGAPRPSGIGAGDMAGKKINQRLHPRDLVAQAAELGVKDPIGERLDPRFERHPPVLIPEESRIGEPRSEHAFVTGNDCLPAIGREIVGNEQKARGERAVGICRQEKYF